MLSPIYWDKELQAFQVFLIVIEVGYFVLYLICHTIKSKVGIAKVTFVLDTSAGQEQNGTEILELIIDDSPENIPETEGKINIPDI